MPTVRARAAGQVHDVDVDHEGGPGAGEGGVKKEVEVRVVIGNQSFYARPPAERRRAVEVADIEAGLAGAARAGVDPVEIFSPNDTALKLATVTAATDSDVDDAVSAAAALRAKSWTSEGSLVWATQTSST